MTAPAFDYTEAKQHAWAYLMRITDNGALKVTDDDVAHDPNERGEPMWFAMPLRRIANLYLKDRSVTHRLIMGYRLKASRGLSQAQVRATLNILLAAWKRGYRADYMAQLTEARA